MNVGTWGIRLILGCLVVGTAGTGWAYEPYKERKYPIKLTGKTIVSAVSGQKGLKTKVLSRAATIERSGFSTISLSGTAYEALEKSM